MTASDRPGGLAEVLDDHLAAEFATRDVDATMATMTGDPYLNHVPVMTGGTGPQEVCRFYDQVFIGHWPADLSMRQVSRTVGAGRVVDELVLSFTHDIPMDHLLSGVPPTAGRCCWPCAWWPASATASSPTSTSTGSGLAAGPGGPAGPGRAAGHRAEQAHKLLDPRSIPANALLGPDLAPANRSGRA
jgi:carboxymethylenebutenolidase